MTENEANKIIAEYMGMRVGIFWKFLGCSLRLGAFYTESLDTLVPVWEKMGTYELLFKFEAYDRIGWFLDMKMGMKEYEDNRGDGTLLHLSITESAAINTAKAIQQLGENNG